MNKSLKKLTAILLCFCMIFATATPVFAADTTQNVTQSEEHITKMEKKASFYSGLLQFLLNDVLINIISKLIPNLSFVGDYSQVTPGEHGYFYEGNDAFIETDGQDYTWRLGYASKSVIPDDFGTMFKYARGSYAPWGYATEMYTDDEGKAEDMKVRTIILDDKSGRGLTVFASVDCIGLSNTDVSKIRAAIDEFAKEKGIISVNVSAIHTHMAIDSQGVWNAPLTTVANNFASLAGVTTTKFGVNEDYLNTIIERTKETVEEAYADMTDGELTYASIDLEDYFNCRNVPYKLDGNMYRLMFNPYDGSESTVVASFGCHPEVTSYGAEFDSRLSADFVYYMEKLINQAGSNFIYIQGNVGTNSGNYTNSNDGYDLDGHGKAIRYGYEMAYILLSMTDSKAERIALNNELGDKLGINSNEKPEDYTPWYDGLETVEEEKVEAVLNIRSKQLPIEVESTTSQVLIKLGLASNSLFYDKAARKYYTMTEIGYMELGDAVKVLMCPGETYSEILVGGYGLKNFAYPSLRELFGENVILFDLMNDAAGYISPDHTYSVVAYKYNPETDTLDNDSWCLTVSIGKHTASTLVQGYIDLVESVK